MDKTQIGLAGEFYVLAQLSHRGLVGTLTLGNTKSVDILVTNLDLDTLFKLEVKTTDQHPRNDKLFGEGKFFGWTMSKKHEALVSSNLFYCFVALDTPSTMPRFFIVPSQDVAEYVRWQHIHWLSTRVNPVKETTMRRFRIPVSDPKAYENQWAVFEV